MSNFWKSSNVCFRHLATLCFSVVLPAMCSFTATATLANDRDALLKDVLRLNTANLQQLKTWQGRVEVTVRGKSSGGNVDRTADVQFAWDNQNGNWFYRWEFTSAETDIAKGGINAGLFVNGLWHAATLGLPAINVTNGVIITPTSPPEISITQEAFDPHNFFLLRKKPLSERFEFWLKAEEFPWLKLTVSRNDNLVTVEESNNTIEDAKSIYTFDVSKSGVLVSTKSSDFQRQVNVDIEWREQDAVWVPRRFVYRNYTNTDTENYYREFVWKENLVNQTIADNTFTIETLRLLPNTVISDTRDGSRAVLNVPENTHFPASPSEPLQPSAGDNRVFILVCLNLFVLISVVTYLLVRRTKTNTQ